MRFLSCKCTGLWSATKVVGIEFRKTHWQKSISVTILTSTAWRTPWAYDALPTLNGNLMVEAHHYDRGLRSLVVRESWLLGLVILRIWPAHKNCCCWLFLPASGPGSAIISMRAKVQDNLLGHKGLIECSPIISWGFTTQERKKERTTMRRRHTVWDSSQYWLHETKQHTRLAQEGW
jgi:hypothetical protein